MTLNFASVLFQVLHQARSCDGEDCLVSEWTEPGTWNRKMVTCSDYDGWMQQMILVADNAFASCDEPAARKRRGLATRIEQKIFRSTSVLCSAKAKPISKSIQDRIIPGFFYEFLAK